jgi:hypothetical protein
MVKKIIERIKSAGAFSIGVFVGVCYGSVVSTLTTYFFMKSGSLGP